MSRLFIRSDLFASAAATLISLTIFVFTMAPTVTLEHSGALVVAGDHWGIGRVPGYPLWHILANLFTTAFSFVTYRGSPNPAWALNFMSALFGALTCGLVALLTSRTSRTAINGLRGRHIEDCHPISAVAGISAGLLCALCPAFWSQAVVAETHTLTNFLIVLALIAMHRWIHEPTSAHVLQLAGVFSLGIGQSYYLVWLIPVLLIAILFEDISLFVAILFAVMLFAGCVFLFLALYPTLYWIPAIICLAVLWLILPGFILKKGILAVAVVLICASGTVFYAYLPIASVFDPPMDWGNPEYLEGFLHVVNRGQYERINFIERLTDYAYYPKSLAIYLGFLLREFTFPLCMFALVPALFALRSSSKHLKWSALMLMAFAIYSVLVTVVGSPAMDIARLTLFRPWLIPSFLIFAVWIGQGITIVASLLVAPLLDD